MILPVIATTASMLSSALGSVKSARELAKNVSDHELKEQIGAAYETLLDLREHVLTLDEENRKLKAQLAAKAAYVGPVQPHGYFYAAEDGQQQHPLCPICFQAKQQQVSFMSDAQPFAGGIGRECKVCKQAIFERRPTSGNVTRLVRG